MMTQDKVGVTLPYLRLWREWRGLTQEELQELSGVTAATISRLERGAPVRFGTVGKLAKGLRITREELLRSEPKEDRAA